MYPPRRPLTLRVKEGLESAARFGGRRGPTRGRFGRKLVGHESGKRRIRKLVTAVTLGLALGGSEVRAGADEPDRPGDARYPILGCGKAQALALRYLAEQVEGGDQGLREAMTETDVLHYALDLEISNLDTANDTCTITGTNGMTIQSKTAALTEFTFRLRNQYTITSALVNGSTPVTVSTLSTTTRKATLDRAYGMDEVFTLTIAYTGNSVSRGFGSIEVDTQYGTPVVATLSEAYYAYTWWPAKDGDTFVPGDNSDKATLEFNITAPNNYVVPSNGTLLSVETLSGNRQRYHWATDYPIVTYLVSFAATNYNTWTQTYTYPGGSMPVQFYIYPGNDTPANRTAWEKVMGMLPVYANLFGEYPFVDEKYGLYNFNFGGGMEHQTITGLGTFDESVNAHELAHQWWGDLITCKTWNHIWLNEGFATYGAGLWEEFKPGGSGLPALKSYLASRKYTGAGSVYVTDAETADMYAIFDTNTSYNKGSWVLHMLRHVLGNDDFFDALAAYRAAFAYGAAATEDFRAVCEDFYPGGDLNWFFQEWIYGERAPTYNWGWQSTLVNGRNYLLLFIDQTQSASYQRFTMPIDIIVNGTTYVVFNDHDPEHFVVPLPAPATSVQFDPDEWVLRTGATPVTYSPGPPKIVETSPAPGAVREQAAGTTAVTVAFHTNVNSLAAHYTLVGDTTGTQTVTFAYNSGTNTTTLTASGPFLPDTYTLTVSDALTAVNSGQRLDGEIADPFDPASLPSGDGVALGNAVTKFTIVCAFGDADCDGDVDLRDFAAFQTCFTGANGVSAAGCEMMRFDADRDVDLADLAAFESRLVGP